MKASAAHTTESRTHDFGERQTENGRAVILTDRYRTARREAVGLIESDRYKLQDSDFWILRQNAADGSTVYAGLIIAKTGIEKINDHLDDARKFNPRFLLDSQGNLRIEVSKYNGALVATYLDPDHRIWITAEVSRENCRMSYPHNMLEKRLKSRVVLHNAELDRCGIYGEDESDDFAASVTGRSAEAESESADVTEEPKQSDTPSASAPSADTESPDSMDFFAGGFARSDFKTGLNAVFSEPAASMQPAEGKADVFPEILMHEAPKPAPAKPKPARKKQTPADPVEKPAPVKNDAMTLKQALAWEIREGPLKNSHAVMGDFLKPPYTREQAQLYLNGYASWGTGSDKAAALAILNAMKDPSSGIPSASAS